MISRRSNPRYPVWSACHTVPVIQYETRDFSKPQRNDCEIIPPQPEGRDGKEKTCHRRQYDRKRQRRPEIKAEPCVEEGIAVCADGIEGNKAEVQKTGETDHHIQAEGKDDIDTRQNRDIDKIIPEEKRNGEQKAHQEDNGEQPKIGLRTMPLPSTGTLQTFSPLQ